MSKVSAIVKVKIKKVYDDVNSDERIGSYNVNYIGNHQMFKWATRGRLNSARGGHN